MDSTHIRANLNPNSLEWSTYAHVYFMIWKIANTKYSKLSQKISDYQLSINISLLLCEEYSKPKIPFPFNINRDDNINTSSLSTLKCLNCKSFPYTPTSKNFHLTFPPRFLTLELTPVEVISWPL